MFIVHTISHSFGMNTLTAPDESDSRTSSVGRKRASHQLTESLDGPVSSMDSSDDHSSKRSRKRARPNDSQGAEGDTVPSQVQAPINNGLEVTQETSGDRPEAVVPAAISWNKGIQATVRTSFGRSPTLTKMVSDNKPLAAQKVDNGPANEADSHILGDASTSTPEEAPKKKAKPTRPSRPQKRAHQAALDAAANKALKDPGANILDESNLQTPPDSSIGYVKGIGYTLPAPCERRAKEKSSPFVRRDLQENFVPRFFVCNDNVLKNIDQSVVVGACETYIKENYSSEDGKSATTFVKSGAFKGYCKNRLKDAIRAGKGPLSKSNSSASSVNGKDGKDMNGASSKKSSSSLSVGLEGQTSAIPGSTTSNQFSNPSLIEGEDQDAKKEISFLGRLLGKRRRDSTEAYAQESVRTEIVAQTISQSTDNYSRAESAGSALSERTSEQVDEVNKAAEDLEADHQQSLPGPSKQIVDEAELLLIRRYYPSLPNAPSSIRCLTCGDDGHVADSCPQLTCAACGVRGVHFASSCPKNIRCSKCRQQGHQKSDCPEKLALAPSEGVACDKCGSSRHTEQSCHFLWRTFNPDVDSIRKVQNILVDCYNCGADGHFGSECGLHRSALLTGGYTWSVSNRNRYVDSETSSRAISAGKDYRIPPKSKKGFSIKGSAKNNPVKVDDSDEEEGFIRPKIAPPPTRNHIHFADRQPANRNGPQAPRYPPPPSIHNSYPSRDDPDRFRRERSFSPPPRYPDYQQRRGDEQYHNFDRDNGYRPQGRPLSPFRANTNGRQADDYLNVPPPQSLAGKKNSRGPRGRGAGNRGGAARGSANRGRR